MFPRACLIDASMPTLRSPKPARNCHARKTPGGGSRHPENRHETREVRNDRVRGAGQLSSARIENVISSDAEGQPARAKGRRGRRRASLATRTLPFSTMTLSLVSTAFLLCRQSMAFVVLHAPAVAKTRDHPGDSFGGGHSSRRSSPSCPLFAIGSGSTSQNNVTPADGLTTGSTESQSDGARGRRRRLHPESDVFVPTPCSASLEAALAAGSPHFGDIMGRGEGHRGGQEGSLLRHFDAMERVVLTANGNLQRVISSYYNSQVTVDITYCREVEPSVYEREVEISVFDRVFCIAKSLVVLHNPVCAEAVKNGSVGIGQLFRSLDILPNFELLNAGHRTRPSSAFERNSNGSTSGSGSDAGGEKGRKKGAGGGLWRVYDLRSRHVSCRIHEEFPPDLFDLK